MATPSASRRTYDSISDLLAGGRVHGTGDILFVLRGGYAYEVADRAATDADLKTSSGLRLYVLPNPVLWLDAFAPHADGRADDTETIKAWLARGERLSAICRVAHPGPYLTAALDLNADGLPRVLDWNGCTLKARPGTGKVLSLSNPHSQWGRWQMGPVHIDCANLAETGFYLKGAQHLVFPPIHVENSNSHPIVIEGCKGAGVYGCAFTLLYASRNGGQVRLISDPQEGAFRNSANTFNVTAKSSRSDGLYLNYMQGELNVWLEGNQGYGAFINNTRGVNIGGYAERNHGSDDWSFFLTRNARGVQLRLHRMIGDVDPSSPGLDNKGNIFSSSNNQNALGRYFADVTNFGSIATKAITGHGALQEDKGVRIEDGATHDVASRLALGENKVYRAYLFVPGTGRYARADVVVIGSPSSGAPNSVRIENMVADALSGDVVWVTDGSRLQISNRSGADRNVRWSVVALTR